MGFARERVEREMFVSKETAQAIVEEMKAATGHDINLMDDQGVILASTDPKRVGEEHGGAKRLLSQGLQRLVVYDDEEPGTRKGVNLPVYMEGTPVGVIGITGAPEEVAALGTVIQHMTQIMLRNAQRMEQESLLEQARQGFIESWLFSEQAEPGELETRGKLLGIEIRAPWTVVILEVEEGKNQGGNSLEKVREVRQAMFLKHIRPYVSRRKGTLCAVVNQRILLMCRSQEPHSLLTFVDQIRSELESAFFAKVWGGVSAEGRSELEVRRAYQEARTACLAARSGGGILFYNQTSLEFLAQSIPRAIRKDLYQQVLGACSAEEQKELLETVRTYYRCNGNTEQAAQSLFIHKNTFHYRLQKVREKTGCNIRVPRESVLLYLCSLFAQLEDEERK